MTGSYSLTLVVASYCVAVIASYTAIYFSTRLFELEGAKRQIWLAAGALCLGSGIWSMHFVGMSAYEMPSGMEMSFNGPLTLLSWAPALLASALALYVITLPDISARAIALAALVMGAAICGMHYTGMAAAIYPADAEAATGNALRGDWMGVPTAIAASVLLLLGVYVAYSDIRELEAARKRQQQASDVRLVRFSKDVGRVFDDADLVVRYSGSSFMVVLENMGRSALNERVLQLRIALESSGKVETWGWGTSAFPASASNTRGLILAAQRVRQWVNVETGEVGLRTA